jgi:hypothetical protein
VSPLLTERGGPGVRRERPASSRRGHRRLCDAGGSSVGEGAVVSFRRGRGRPARSRRSESTSAHGDAIGRAGSRQIRLSTFEHLLRLARRRRSAAFRPVSIPPRPLSPRPSPSDRSDAPRARASRAWQCTTCRCRPAPIPKVSRQRHLQPDSGRGEAATSSRPSPVGPIIDRIHAKAETQS